MQLLAGSRRGRPLAAFTLLVTGLGLLAVGLAWAVVAAFAATILPGPLLAASPIPTARHGRRHAQRRRGTRPGRVATHGDRDRGRDRDAERGRQPDLRSRDLAVAPGAVEPTLTVRGTGTAYVRPMEKNCEVS